MRLIIIIYILFSAELQWVNGDNGHPLDPLSFIEIRDTVDTILATRPDIQFSGVWQFNWITLKEPEKSLLLPYYLKDLSPPFQSEKIPRRSLTILIERLSNSINEIVVNLRSRVVESWVKIPRGFQATYTVQDNVDGESIAKSDNEVQERCRQMGWFDMDLVVGETWGIGYAEDRPVFRNAIRPIQVYFYGKLFEGDNHFAHPFDFVVTVDLALKTVIQIDNLPTHSNYNANDRNGNECPKRPANYNPKFFSPSFYRKDVHPIFFTQPQGPGYILRGNEVYWQKFKFRVGFNGREGLVLHHINYKDGENVRPLFYRISVGELFVPYGDARKEFAQKFPFDEGEFTLGFSAVDTKAAKICRGGAVSYLDVYLNDDNGNPILLPSVVCIHEEDAGLLWAHFDRTGRTYHTRSTRLVLTTYSNLGNYDYKLSWRFYQDATVEFYAELHGLLSTQLLALNVTNAGGFGTVVSPQINAQYHQHNLGIRIDAEIDGNINAVLTKDIVPLPDPSGSPRNPYGQGFTTVEKVLSTPTEARTIISPFTGRTWLISNPTRIHPFTKKPVTWKLLPFNAPLPFVRHDSPMHPKCAWTDYNVWVTKYKENQLYPGGFYLNGSGLPEWVKNEPNTDLTGTDVVLWYIYAFTHIPRSEDYPIMPLEQTGFALKPTNFFLQNPALDVPPPPEGS